MKRSLILIIGMMVAVATLYANDNYTQAMQNGLEKLAKAQSPSAYLEASNTFERIAAVEKEKWLPSYYSAYSLTIYAAMNNDPQVKDKYLDKAQNHLKSAAATDPNNAEVHALQGFIYLIRIGVDPQNRGQEFSGKSGAELAKARELDPSNPRVMYLTAQLNYGVAQFFGKDGSEACEMNQQALAMFDTYSNQTPFYPSWGKNMALGFQERCN